MAKHKILIINKILLILDTAKIGTKLSSDSQNQTNGGNIMNDVFFPTIRYLFDSNLFDKKTESHFPHFEVKENDVEFEIIAATPGLKKENLSVEIKDGALKIESVYKKDESKKYTFTKLFQVDEKIVDCSRTRSFYENGELKILLPKKKEERKDYLKINIE